MRRCWRVGVSGAVDFRSHPRGRLAAGAWRRAWLPGLPTCASGGRDGSRDDAAGAALGGSSRLERFEFSRAMNRAPPSAVPCSWSSVYHEQYLRRELPLGVRPTIRHRIALERRRLASKRRATLRWANRRPGCPAGGPSSRWRPRSGPGVPERSATPIALGEPIRAGPGRGREEFTAYMGCGARKGRGVGSRARGPAFRSRSSESASTSLVLEVSADGFLGRGRSRQRLDLSVNGAAAASLTIDSGGLREELIVLPGQRVPGRPQSLDLVFGRRRDLARRARDR